MRESAIAALERELFLEALRRRHGYDFTGYAKASLHRRLDQLLLHSGREHLAELLPDLLRDPDMLPRVLSQLSVPVTEMFRDPATFLALRNRVIPVLRTYPNINVWQTGCATGEEVYSLAILLAEEGLYDKTRIYATDINDSALERAEDGIIPLRHLRDYAANYQAAGGSGSLADYFHVRYDFARLDEAIRSRIVFAHHNLVADGVFCEAHLILCRNILIYFEKPLQDKVLLLFRQSLVRGGFLCLGTRESLRFSSVAEDFETIDADQRIYRSRLRLNGTGASA